MLFSKPTKTLRGFFKFKTPHNSSWEVLRALQILQGTLQFPTLSICWLLQLQNAYHPLPCSTQCCFPWTALFRNSFSCLVIASCWTKCSSESLPQSEYSTKILGKYQTSEHLSRLFPWPSEYQSAAEIWRRLDSLAWEVPDCQLLQRSRMEITVILKNVCPLFLWGTSTDGLVADPAGFRHSDVTGPVSYAATRHQALCSCSCSVNSAHVWGGKGHTAHT